MVGLLTDSRNEPCRARTCDPLIKSPRKVVPPVLSSAEASSLSRFASLLPGPVLTRALLSAVKVAVKPRGLSFELAHNRPHVEQLSGAIKDSFSESKSLFQIGSDSLGPSSHRESVSARRARPK